MQLLHRNFNQVKRGFSTVIFFSINSEQQGHSIVATVFNAVDGNIYSVGVPSFKEITSASILNSHDCPIEPFKVRGHLSITVLVSITG